MFDVIKLLASFALALACVAALMVLYYGAAGASASNWSDLTQIWSGVFITIMLIGLALGSPLLLAACILLLLFQERIREHLQIWCTIGPLIVVALYLGVDYVALNKSNIPIAEYLTLAPVLVRAAAALGVSVLTAVIFYWWSRSELRKSTSSQRRSAQH